MKKILSLLLAAFLLLSVMGTTALASLQSSSPYTEFTETFTCDGTYTTVEGQYFTLSSPFISHGGWEGGLEAYPLKITARDNNVHITHVEAHVCFYGNLYYDVGVSSGTKVPESLGLTTTGDVAVIDVDARDFAFTNGRISVPFDSVTVYFTNCGRDGHAFDGRSNVCPKCGQTHCEAEGHQYGGNHVCLNCGKSQCELEGHSFACTVCGQKTDGVYECKECGAVIDLTKENPPMTGSAFSEGSLAVLVGVAGLAIGLVAGLLIGKKKPVPVSGENE